MFDSVLGSCSSTTCHFVGLVEMPLNFHVYPS